MLRTAARRLVARSFAPALPLRVTPMRFFCQQRQPTQPIQPTSESSESSETNASEVDEEVDEEEVDEEVEEEEKDLPGTIDEFGYFNEKPIYACEPKMTRTSFAAHQLWELCAEEGMDLRLLGEMFNRMTITLKSNDMAEYIFSRKWDPDQSVDEDLKRTKPLDAEQMKRCNRFKEEYLICNLANEMFEDLAPLKISREFKVFVKTIMGMIKNNKLQYLKQFSDEFARFNHEGFNEIPVKVVTAFKLSTDQRELVMAWLEAKNILEGTPLPTFVVNPKIMGGVHIVWDNQVEVMATIAPWFERGLANIKDGFGSSNAKTNNIFIQ